MKIHFLMYFFILNKSVFYCVIVYNRILSKDLFWIYFGFIFIKKRMLTRKNETIGLICLYNLFICLTSWIKSKFNFQTRTPQTSIYA
jgi:hypothetical protein